jgi:hypothetical protein
MMKNKSLLILEIIWITTGVLCLAAGTSIALQTGGNRVIVFFLMAATCFLFGWLRHKQRKKS